MHPEPSTSISVAALTLAQREAAMVRFAVLRPILEEGVPLTRAAVHASVARRTAQRWLSRFPGRRWTPPASPGQRARTTVAASSPRKPSR